LVDVSGAVGEHLYFCSLIYEGISAGRGTVKSGMVYFNLEYLCILCDVAFLTGFDINLLEIQIGSLEADLATT
jgi:hypothetical protein